MSRDDATLLDMARAARQAIAFTSDLSMDEFLSDERTQAAVLHRLVILGEAAKRLSGDLTNRHDHVPWRLIAGLRDRLIHAYDAVDLHEVWMVLQRDLPKPLNDLEPLLPRKGRQ